MESVRRAVIDVGTNSVKLLVAEVLGSKVHPLWEGSHQTRLGKGLFKTHRLDPTAVESTAKVVADFATKAREHRASSIRAIATSAARDATNAQDLIDAVKHAAGLDLEIISGSKEALYAYQGVVTADSIGAAPLLILDLGGGSTEMVLGASGKILYSGSFKIGTVRLMELAPHSDPPLPQELLGCRKWVKGVLDEEVIPEVQPHLTGVPPVQIIATGGTATVLGCIHAGLSSFERDRLDGLVIPLHDLRELTRRLWSLPLSERRKIRGLPPERADVILTGSIIYQVIMECFAAPELRVSTRGLRFAAALDSTG